MEKDIKEIIELGETETVEFKLNFNNNVIISTNAFANTKGGKIIIGVKDNGTLLGIDINSETIQNWIHPIR